MISRFHLLAEYSSGPTTSDFRMIERDVERQIRRLRNLGSNWSVMGEGEPISEEVAHEAREIYFILWNVGVESFVVQPGLGGEILLRGHKGPLSFDVIVLPGDEFELYVEHQGKAITERESLSKNELVQAVREISNR